MRYGGIQMERVYAETKLSPICSRE